MKVFLTGASGILGTDLMKQFQENNHEVLGFSSADINLTDLNDVGRKMEAFKPDLVIHSAAMTAVDLCETAPELAYAINVKGTAHMALAARAAGSKLVYISSCGVYGNGKTTPYHEMDATRPLNYHHQTKLEAEKQVKENHENYLIVRPGWLFGGSRQHKKNFVEARRQEALSNPVLKSAFDKQGSPTYTKDLAQQLLRVLNDGHTGLFNMVNEGEATRFSYVAELIHALGMDNRVEPVDSSRFVRAARMPDNESLENRNLNLNNCNQMRHWKLALRDYINTNY
ncbi:NAD(P)-dependent oxidoreductase [Pedobacter sp. MC2016-14]|uniref:SDR family oxidoreductase n=1 Tax=Pedobacter sp. MC2016-14 TaxID=2897327 RepID=UPI001E49856B|nr:sugar nucleotide-binding protein [Pedobacter sp. MC2016-14]MCD0486945.1 NAD(P)-dependent oxidoreductase [Pedobacter sp. MC2016-14]